MNRTFGKTLFCLGVVNLVFFWPLHAQDCDAILRHGLRNIQVSKSTEAAVATKFFNHCHKDFSKSSDDAIGSAEMEIFGFLGGGGGFSRAQREERLISWCKENREFAQSRRGLYEESQIIYGEAVAAWQNCNSLKSKDVRIQPYITPDAKTVEITLHYYGSTRSGVRFYGVNQEGFDCDISVPSEGGVAKFDPAAPPEIKNEAIAITCHRRAAESRSLDDEQFQVLPRGVIGVRTASYPLQLFFPEEWAPTLPRDEAERLGAAVQASVDRFRDLEEQLADTETELSSLKSTSIKECRVCFMETEGSDQCQENRNSCSEWSASGQGWTTRFRDDTDNRSGGCYYQWRVECR